MAWTRAGIAVGAFVAVALAALSGGTRADPRTPPALPGLPPPFLDTAVIGSGGRTAAVDAYGDVVGLWTPGPAGRALIHNPSDRQAAGSVPADTGIVARMSVKRGPVPLWQADSVAQRYLPETNVLITTARLGGRGFEIVRAIRGRLLECVAGMGIPAGEPCPSPAIAAAAAADRRWLERARPLGAEAPRWALAMYRRSLLALLALTDRRTGAVAAGARDGWAYIWPRDASAVAMALASAGYRAEARRVARFLRKLDLAAAARFRGTGEPVPGRGAQGDAAGWVAAAARATRLAVPRLDNAWRDRADYQEGDPADLLGNAIAATSLDGPKTGLYHPESARRPGEVAAAFGGPDGLVRRAGDPSSGLDSAAAWAVRPFQLRPLYPLAGRTLLHLAAHSTRYGIVPSEGWTGGKDPWSAPTAWTAWSLAALARTGPRRFPGAALRDRRAALRLMADLRRAATPTGLLPERVDAHTGVPRSTTPLAWSHAFAILALRELWPGRAGS